MRRKGSFLAVLSTLLCASSAWALTQPGSSELIPVIDESVTTCSDNNVQLCLDEEEGGKTIDAQQDGGITPETFDPRCELTFHILNRGADYNNVFGWYNVKRDGDGNSIKPELADLNTFIRGNEEAPFERALALRDDPDYEGGEIAFFIATGPSPQAEVGGPPSNYNDILYSEREHNPPQSGEPRIALIIWQSVEFQDSFYFGWEDQLATGDDDFDDIFTRVSGIQCAGGGDACDTGEPGICADGTEQCQQGELTCVPNNPARDETCNALDDDCNGETDDGDLCDAEEICVRGKCVPECGTGEFRCGEGFVCSGGACVEASCVDVECPEGQVCTGGDCIDACDDVTCPFGQICRIGVCIDPCDSIECDEGYSCHLGVCVDCDCVGCSDGQSCVQNVCIEDECASVSCDSGTHCQAGNCLDNCEGVACPGGAACSAGECEPIDPSGTPGAGGENNGTGGISIGTGATAATGSGADGSGASNSSGGSNGLGSGDDNGDSGCGCRTAAGTGLGAFAAWVGAFGVAGLVARRRRRSRCAS